MDVNVEIDELVVDGADEAALQVQLAGRLDPATAAAVARAVATSVSDLPPARGGIAEAAHMPAPNVVPGTLGRGPTR